MTWEDVRSSIQPGGYGGGEGQGALRVQGSVVVLVMFHNLEKEIDTPHYRPSSSQ